MRTPLTKRKSGGCKYEIRNAVNLKCNEILHLSKSGMHVPSSGHQANLHSSLPLQAYLLEVQQSAATHLTSDKVHLINFSHSKARALMPTHGHSSNFTAQSYCGSVQITQTEHVVS